MELLAEKIKRLRTARQLTQLQLAKKTGVSRVAVTKWENGDTENLKLANLKRLCAAFDMSVTDLLDEKASLGVNQLNADYKIPPQKNGATLMSDRQDPDIAAVVAMMQATDKAGRSVSRVAVKVALDAYRPAQSNHAS